MHIKTSLTRWFILYLLLYSPLFLRSKAEKAHMLEARTLDEKMTLEGLKCYQNYSIQVVASTKVGDGLKSRSIYCRTKEDRKCIGNSH